ncbi:MAG: hypothetical protein EOP04_07935 [Proteobacteria bacterium]|nr:MAG: hypothetical protein EOP04_07935 [Pseudomonadota bacterium]
MDDSPSALVILIIICNLALINALFSGQAGRRNFSPARRKAAGVGRKKLKSKVMDYNCPRWIQKRKEIFTRDNFTCLNCKKFNPSFEPVVFRNDSEKSQEWHFYTLYDETGSFENRYSFSSERLGTTIFINFGFDELVLPALQVHHKRYIFGREAWDYDGKFLETLCKTCHLQFHKQNAIRTYDLNGNIIHDRLYLPENSDSTFDQFDPWTFKNRAHGGTPRISTIVKPKFSYLKFPNTDQGDPEWFSSVLQTETKKFLTRYFPKNFPNIFQIEPILFETLVVIRNPQKL